MSLVGKESLELFDIPFSFLFRSYRIDLELIAVRKADGVEDVLSDVDHLRIEHRIRFSDDFGSDLMVLPVSSFLGSLISEMRLDIVEIDGLSLLKETFQISAHHSCGRFRLEDKLASFPIIESIHLFRYDIRRFSDRPLEEFDLFEDRGGYPRESVLPEFVPAHFLEECEISLVFTVYVLHSAYSLWDFHVFFIKHILV